MSDAVIQRPEPTMARSGCPVTLFFDACLPRAACHRAEETLRSIEMIGRMARFDLQPETLIPDRLPGQNHALLHPV